ncbi:hypothetical protein [Caulobacter rhizosphaerae]|uniref:hypothetical protein n=1 Tax=Caulobacter rhizosphaerae TaxID=2010972 RepID=UPI0013D1536C|nr:hypothetical protein [Caulobacter rhizosphaerae]GGL48094.1 hypothetical protein GCM10010983_51830 [Caulobacter rhizosphaerae]
MIAVLQIAGGIWAAGSLIVLAMLIADHIGGAGVDRWMCCVLVALGPLALVAEAYIRLTDHDPGAPR